MMKNVAVFCIIVLISAGVSSCELDNPIMEKWWEEGDPEEPLYIPIIKTLPAETLYKTIVDTEYIYKTIYEQLPPEVVIQYVPQYIKETEYKPVYEYIYETETQYKTIYEEITRDPTEEEIQEFIKQLDPDYIFKYLTDEQKQHIENLLPADYQTIYETITEDPDDEEMQEFIKQLEPETVFQYLSDEQIQYIKDQIPPDVIIQQLPPQILLQSISIVDIEYVIFSGDATAYNVNSPTPGGTSLTTQEKSTNDDIVNAMAEMLKSKDYMLILHGHANPVSNKPEETAQLVQISLDRANAVETKLASLYSGAESLDNRITTKGYGGERNVAISGSSAYSSLNRRVEAILFTIGTSPASGGS